MKYLVEYTTPDNPYMLQAVLVDPVGGCTRDELWGEIARKASNIIKRSATFVSYAYFESNEGAEANAAHCYPKRLESPKSSDLIKLYHKHYDLCYQAHRNVSFSPEKRALQTCAEFDAAYKELRELGASQEALEKLERLFVAWQGSKSNCLSSMITGPARFPTRRAEKANNAEQNKYQEYSSYFNQVKSAIERERYYEQHPEARPISNSDDDALARLRDKLAKLESEREMNNAINKIVRSKPKAECTPEKVEELEKLGLSKAVISQIFKPDFSGAVGIPSYVNQNLGGNIKRVKERIAELESTAQRETEETELPGGVQFVIDTESMRVYFEFPGKPDEETRTLLKSNGFKWTPSQGHWGRKLTSNAEYSAKRVASALKSLQPALSAP
jgi:hypothetical protein